MAQKQLVVAYDYDAAGNRIVRNKKKILIFFYKKKYHFLQLYFSIFAVQL